MSYSFVITSAFTPNTGSWTPFGNVSSHQQQGNTIALQASGGYSLNISFLGPRAFRVRFAPTPNPEYATERSYAVVSRNLGAVTLNLEAFGDHLMASTGSMTVRIDLQPYRIRVYRGNQLVCADELSYNLIYIPGAEMIANFKTYPANALYCGFGEKGGSTLFKNQTSITFFNYDNFTYSTGRISSGNGGPANPNEPLYCSVPLLLETNPAPVNDYAGPAYCYGIYFDNPSQSYVNIGLDDYNTSMFGKYYFGALYGEMDYYFMLGDVMSDVLAQYTTLTGRSPMPPKYVFGFHQGGYGYYDRFKLSAVANSYRAARIPIDGLHIDVDFQNNYRTFTHSELKFPNVRELMDDLHGIGFKCSTNITPLLTDNPLDENGQMTVYSQRQALENANALIFGTLAGEGPSSNLYTGTVSYGANDGTNPYPYPPLKPNNQGVIPLGASGNYSDYGKQAVPELWGQQYRHLIQDVGMDMIWQDMMCPAIAADSDEQPKTFPLALMIDRGDGTYVPNAKIHNVYGLNLLKATSGGIDTLRRAVKNQRNFIIARGGFAGMQRYAGLWTGDSPSSWEYLGIYIAQTLNIGLSGIPISGSDIGGFANGPIPSGTAQPNYVAYGQVFGGITNYELLTRWMQVGAFLPWYRNHYNGYTKQFQEVYQYGEPVPTNCRKFVELRYRMIQVFYDAMYEWTQSGLPIARALFINDPADPQVYNHVDDEFFVGRDFLVAPIITQHDTAQPPTPPIRQVYLPAGSQWYSFKDNRAPLDTPVDGGTLIPNWYAALDQVPIYIRAGAILPMRELEQWVRQMPANPITINVYPGPDSTYRLYQDDGISFDAQDHQTYRLTEISHTGIPGGQNVRVHRLQDHYTPPETFYFLAFSGTRHPSSVTISGNGLPDVGSPDALTAATGNAYYFNASIGVTFVKVFDRLPDVTLTVLF
jgi:alpha-glucosidase